MTTWADVAAKIQGVSHTPRYTLYSVCGTYVGWNVGYPFDLGDALEQAGIVEHQPVMYGPGGIPSAFPMQPSIDSGVAELKRLILLRDPSIPWAMVGYSQGAIVTSNIYDEIRNGDLKAYEASFLGGVTFGNPRREKGHTIPGGIDPGGHGIVTPNLVNTEAKWWDFAAGKGMAGSPGNDLYTTCGAGESAVAEADQEAVWQIVDKGTLSSMKDLATQILKVIPHPLSGGIGAAQAALGALGFFAKGTAPHVNYQFIQPVAGDPRDCWRMALDYLTQLSPVKEETPMSAPVTPTAPAAPAAPHTLDIVQLKAEIKAAVDGLLVGLQFVSRFSSVIPAQYVPAIDTAIKVLTLVDGLL